MQEILTERETSQSSRKAEGENRKKASVRSTQLNNEEKLYI